MSRSPVRPGRSYHFLLGIKFEHFEVECVPDALEVRLPSLFSNQHRHEVPDSVSLFDHRGNDFEVAIVKRGCDVYLSNGWRQVGRWLGLHDGGWIKMIYVNRHRFFIEARDRLFNPAFSHHGPSVIRLNGEPRVTEIVGGTAAVVDPSLYVGRKPTIVMSFYATLQSCDVNTPFLHLPRGFCNAVFPHGDFDITIVDEDGKPWSCHLINPTCHAETDVLIRGWDTIVESLTLEEGMAYKLEVPVDTTSLIFFSGR